MESFNRRKFLKYLGAAGVASCLPNFSSRTFADTDQKPNILLIHADDLGWADVDFNAPHDWYETPHINALKEAGMNFTNGYAACAVCAPTRAALMTGRYPTRTGITNFIARIGPENEDGYTGTPSQEYLTPINYKFLEPEEVTIAEALKPAGYATCHLGKWHLGVLAEQLPDEQGFDTQKNAECWVDYYDPYKKCESLPSRKEGEYLTDRLTDEAVDFMRTAHRSDSPFFIYLAHHAVHTPIHGKKEYVEYFQNKPKPQGWEHLNPTYAAMIKSLDDSVGKLVAELENLDITDKTMVIFTSDNGGHQPVADNSPLREGKRWPYEGGIREPWIFKYPGVIKAGTSCDTPICSVDVMPTLCELTKTKSLDDIEIDGVSLWPLLKQSSDINERCLFWHFPHYLTDYTGAISPYTIVRKGPWKLIKWWDSNKPLELYNLDKDISEENNLADVNSKKTRQLYETLHKWLKDIEAKVPIKNPEYKKPGPKNSN